MHDYELVRRLYHHQGMSLRAISRKTKLHRRTIKKMLEHASPPGYQLTKPRPKSKLDPFTAIIDQILEADKQCPAKQRHTAKRIFDRLCEEHGFDGKYTIVKDYVREKRLDHKEVYLPLTQKPGTSQVDFGGCQVIIGGVKQSAHFFCMALPYSDAVYVQAYPTEGFEAVAAGHNSAYRFFEGVPPESLFDNMSTAVKSITQDKGRELTDDFVSLRSHYVFNSRFCNVARANEKGVVERLVGYIRRNFMVPIPRFPSWEAFNDHLEQLCRQRFSQKAAGKEKSIGELLDEERASFLPLPPTEFEACRKEARNISSLALVKHKTSSYSVPVEYAYRKATIKAYVFEIKVVYKDQVIASHSRSYLRDDFVFDPVHYLPLLKRKPGGLEGALPFASWQLPEAFGTLRNYLEARDGTAGKKEYIQVLQLLRDYSLSKVSKAIERAFEHSCVRFDSVKMLLLSSDEPSVSILRLAPERMQGLPKVQVNQADTTRYRRLMGGGIL